MSQNYPISPPQLVIDYGLTKTCFGQWHGGVNLCNFLGVSPHIILKVTHNYDLNLKKDETNGELETSSQSNELFDHFVQPKEMSFGVS